MIKQTTTTPVHSARLPWYILSVTVILISVYVRLRLLGVPLERDEGEYAYMGQLMLKGIPPFAEAYSMKLPGVYGAYALLLYFFGQSVEGIHFGLLLVNLACVMFVFLLGRKIFDVRTGSVAAAIFSLWSVSQSVLGVFAHATHFLILFALAGYLLMLLAIEKGNRLMLLSAGICFGISVTMKQHAALIITFAMLYYLFHCIRYRTPLKSLLSQLALFSGGVILPYLIWFCYFLQKGLLDKFWFWTVTYASEYASEHTLREGWYWLTVQGTKMVETTWALWILAVIGLLCLVIKRDEPKALLITFLAGSSLAVVPGYYFRPHYFVMMLPVLSLLAAHAVTMPLSGSGRNLLRSGVSLAVFLLAVSAVIYEEGGYLFTFSHLRVMRVKYWTSPFPESVDAATYLKSVTFPGERIGILGSEPQILFYSDRLSATRHIYMYGLMEEQPFSKKMQEDLIRDFETSRPRYVVNVASKDSWALELRSERKIFSWADEFLARYYQPVGLFDIIYPKGSTVQVWGNDLAGYIPKGKSQMIIYRRK